MNKQLTLLAAGALVLGVSSQATAEELGGGFSVASDVAFTSNYIFRGVTENDEEPAIQGGLEFGHESGAYVGIWGSSGAVNSDFGVELGPYLGYGFDITSDVWGDVGVYYYNFPEDTDDDFAEIYGGVGTDFGVAAADLYVHVSDDYVASDETSIYVETNWTAPLAGGLYAMAHLGYLDIDLDDDGYDWAVGIGYELGSLDLNVMVADQDEASDTQTAVTLSRDF